MSLIGFRWPAPAKKLVRIDAKGIIGAVEISAICQTSDDIGENGNYNLILPVFFDIPNFLQTFSLEVPVLR